MSEEEGMGKARPLPEPREGQPMGGGGGSHRGPMPVYEEWSRKDDALFVLAVVIGPVLLICFLLLTR